MWGSSLDSPDSLVEKQKVLSALDSTGVSGVHLLAGLGYCQALDDLLTFGADPSAKVGCLLLLFLPAPCAIT